MIDDEAIKSRVRKSCAIISEYNKSKKTGSRALKAIYKSEFSGQHSPPICYILYTIGISDPSAWQSLISLGKAKSPSAPLRRDCDSRYKIATRIPAIPERMDYFLQPVGAGGETSPPPSLSLPLSIYPSIYLYLSR